MPTVRCAGIAIGKQILWGPPYISAMWDLDDCHDAVWLWVGGDLEKASYKSHLILSVSASHEQIKSWMMQISINAGGFSCCLGMIVALPCFSCSTAQANLGSKAGATIQFAVQ